MFGDGAARMTLTLSLTYANMGAQQICASEFIAKVAGLVALHFPVEISCFSTLISSFQCMIVQLRISSIVK